jgi:hypothetical protein
MRYSEFVRTVGHRANFLSVSLWRDPLQERGAADAPLPLEGNGTRGHPLATRGVRKQRNGGSKAAAELSGADVTSAA